MRKYVFAVVLLLATVATYAQEGVTNIGFNIGNVEPIDRYRSGKDAEGLDKKYTLDGVKLGFVCEHTFVKGFGMQVGLNYAFGVDNGKWTKIGGMAAYQERTDLFYQFIEVPVDIQYKFLIAKKTYLGLYTGPTVMVGLTNTQRYRVKLGDNITTDLKNNMYTYDCDGDGILDNQRVNVTWGVGLSFQYDRYFIRGGYDWGIMNSYKDDFHNAHGSGANNNDFNNLGRMDQWSLKLGIYFWSHEGVSRKKK